MVSLTFLPTGLLGSLLGSVRCKIRVYKYGKYVFRTWTLLISCRCSRNIMRVIYYSTFESLCRGQVDSLLHLCWHTPWKQPCPARRPGRSASRRKHRSYAAGTSCAQAPRSSPVLDTPHAPAPPLHPLLRGATPKGYRCPICFGSEHSRSLLAEHVVRAACMLQLHASLASKAEVTRQPICCAALVLMWSLQASQRCYTAEIGYCSS